MTVVKHGGRRGRVRISGGAGVKKLRIISSVCIVLREFPLA